MQNVQEQNSEHKASSCLCVALAGFFFFCFFAWASTFWIIDAYFADIITLGTISNKPIEYEDGNTGL